MTNQEIAEAIAIEFKKVFPNGYVNSYARKGFSNNEHIAIKYGLIEDLSDCSNKIRENDPLHTLHMIWTDNDEFTIDHTHGQLYVNPREKYFAMSSVKTKIRNGKSPTSEKLIAKYIKHFKKVAETVKQNESDIFGRDKINDKYFQINC